MNDNKMRWLGRGCVSLVLLGVGFNLGGHLPNKSDDADASLKARLLEKRSYYARSYSQEKHEADSLSSVIRTYREAQRNGPNKDHMYAVYSGWQGEYGVKWYDAEDLRIQFYNALDRQEIDRRNASQDSAKYETYKEVFEENGIKDW